MINSMSAVPFWRYFCNIFDEKWLKNSDCSGDFTTPKMWLRINLMQSIEDDIKTEFGVNEIELFSEHLISARGNFTYGRYEKLEMFFEKTKIDASLIKVINIVIKNSQIKAKDKFIKKDFIQDINSFLNQIGLIYDNERKTVTYMNALMIEQEKEAVQIMKNLGFEETNRLFNEAKTHLNLDKYEDAITDYCRAFESMIKVICEKRGLAFHSETKFGELLHKLKIDNFFGDKDQDTSLNCLVESMKISLTRIRNENGAHGNSKTLTEEEHKNLKHLALLSSNLFISYAIYFGSRI